VLFPEFLGGTFLCKDPPREKRRKSGKTSLFSCGFLVKIPPLKGRALSRKIEKIQVLSLSKKAGGLFRQRGLQPAAAHELPVCDGQLARLQAERYFFTGPTLWESVGCKIHFP
jgi:hypothetical protein